MVQNQPPAYPTPAPLELASQRMRRALESRWLVRGSTSAFCPAHSQPWLLQEVVSDRNQRSRHGRESDRCQRSRSKRPPSRTAKDKARLLNPMSRGVLEPRETQEPSASGQIRGD